MAEIPENGFCYSQSDDDDGEVTDKRQEHALESMQHDVENRSGSAEDITKQTDDSSYYVTWTVDIALAVPGGKSKLSINVCSTEMVKKLKLEVECENMSVLYFKS